MRIHFVGIGGIGVSALAQYYLAKGHTISGSDLVGSEITEALQKRGAKIFIVQNPNFEIQNSKLKFEIQNSNLVVYSPAVSSRHPELKLARQQRIKCQSYPEALGELTKTYFTIAVSGTHGKSTTASMLSLILVKAGLDPTVIIGTKLKEFGNSNCRVGRSKYLVIEADEHFGSFLNYWPQIIVLTNIEPDHLDYYKNYDNLLKAFREFIGHLPKDGILIQNSNLKKPTVHTQQNDNLKLKNILKVPGEHNVYNATLALATARALGIPDKISFKALSEYKGCWRRFEIVNKKPLTVSDYGHHPTEIEATLKAAREKWPERKIWCVYQPHQHQRTHYLFNDFVAIFRRAPADKIMITDIYDVAGREEKKIKKEVSAEKLVRAVNRKKVIYLPTEKIVGFVKKNLPQDAVLIIMGAGDIYKLINIFGHKGNRVDRVSPRMRK